MPGQGMSEDPHVTRCLPPGTPRIYATPYLVRILQSLDQVVFLYEYVHQYRVVPLGNSSAARD